MKAHDPLQVRAEAGHLKDHRAAETIADRHNLRRIDGLVLIEEIISRHEARLRNPRVRDGFHHELLRVAWVIGLSSIAVHVECKRGVAFLGEHTRAPPHVLVVPPPLVDHDHTGTSTFVIAVPSNVPLERGITRLVGDFLSLDVRLGSSHHDRRHGAVALIPPVHEPFTKSYYFRLTLRSATSV